MKHLFAFALPDAGLKVMALARIRRSKTANDVLYSNRTDVVNDAPAVPSSLSLAEALDALKATAQGLGATLGAEGDGTLFFTWRSPLIGFPNGAHAFVEAGETGTQVSLYGHALYGRRDFGANRAFIERLAHAVRSD